MSGVGFDREGEYDGRAPRDDSTVGLGVLVREGVGRMGGGHSRALRLWYRRALGKWILGMEYSGTAGWIRRWSGWRSARLGGLGLGRRIWVEFTRDMEHSMHAAGAGGGMVLTRVYGCVRSSNAGVLVIIYTV